MDKQAKQKNRRQTKEKFGFWLTTLIVILFLHGILIFGSIILAGYFAVDMGWIDNVLNSLTGVLAFSAVYYLIKRNKDGVTYGKIFFIWTMLVKALNMRYCYGVIECISWFLVAAVPYIIMFVYLQKSKKVKKIYFSS